MVSLFKKTDSGSKADSSKEGVSGKAGGSATGASKKSKTSQTSTKTGKRSTVKKVSTMLSAPAQIMGPRLLFVLSVVILCAVGLVMVYSASSIMALNSADLGNDPAYYLKRQALFMGVGLAACIACAAIPYKFWARPIVFVALWLFTVMLLLATSLGLGITELGAERSIYIAGFALQPSEFAKIAIIMTLASLFEMQRERPLSGPKFVAAAFLCIVIPLYLIYKQPDLGTAIILLVGAISLMWLVGVRLSVIVIILALCAAYVAVVCIVQPYHLDRITSMFDPWVDPQGKGFQSIQSLYALGSGGIFGTGLGLSRQKYLYLPYAHTDFIYAIIGEELGLIGTVFVALLFAAFILGGLRIARNAPDIYGGSLAGALTVMVGFQACVNMACVIGIAPVTGKALPFISYGGSSIIATMIVVGLVLSVSLRSSADAVYEQRRDNLFVISGNANGPGGQRSAGGFAALQVISGIKDRVSRASEPTESHVSRTQRSTQAAPARSKARSTGSSSTSEARSSEAHGRYTSSSRSSKRSIYDTGYSRSASAHSHRSSSASSSAAYKREATRSTSSASRTSRSGGSQKSGYSASLKVKDAPQRTASTRARSTSSSVSRKSSAGSSRGTEAKGRLQYPTRKSSSSQWRRNNRPGTRR